MSEDLSPADALAQLSFLVYAALEERASERHMSVVQGRMLGILRDRTPLISELGARLRLDKSSISGLVDRAATRGLVERVPSTEDRRAVHVRLTADGRSAIEAAEREFDADVAALLDPLSADDQRLLMRLISSVVAAQAREAGINDGASAH